MKRCSVRTMNETMQCLLDVFKQFADESPEDTAVIQASYKLSAVEYMSRGGWVPSEFIAEVLELSSSAEAVAARDELRGMVIH